MQAVLIIKTNNVSVAKITMLFNFMPKLYIMPCFFCNMIQCLCLFGGMVPWRPNKQALDARHYGKCLLTVEKITTVMFYYYYNVISWH